MRQSLWWVNNAGKYSLMKKRLRQPPSCADRDTIIRRKVFADEEAIETKSRDLTHRSEGRPESIR